LVKKFNLSAEINEKSVSDSDSPGHKIRSPIKLKNKFKSTILTLKDLRLNKSSSRGNSRAGKSLYNES
jgi:hypothetical protein